MWCFIDRIDIADYFFRNKQNLNNEQFIKQALKDQIKSLLLAGKSEMLIEKHPSYVIATGT